MKKALVLSLTLLSLGVTLAACGGKETYINTEQNSYIANVKDEKKVTFETNKGASYSVFKGSKKGKRIVGPNVAKTGSVDLSLVDTGKYVIKATNNDKTKYKTIIVKPNPNRITLEIKNKDGEYKTDDNGNFVIKGAVNKDSEIVVAGTSDYPSEKLKEITKKVKKGSFNVTVPLKLAKDTERTKVDVGAHDIKNDTWATWTLTIDNNSSAYRSAAEARKKESEKASSAAESSSIAESNSISASESASEAAASSKEAYEKSPQSYQSGITYDQLARTPDDYKGKKIQFSGEVIQVMEDDDDTQLRLAVNGDYDRVVYVEVPNSVLKGSHVLEDDQVTISGLSAGTISYKSTMSGKITIPGMIATILSNSSAANSTN